MKQSIDCTRVEHRRGLGHRIAGRSVPSDAFQESTILLYSTTFCRQRAWHKDCMDLQQSLMPWSCTIRVMAQA